MPENPRQGEEHTDIPTSRPGASVPNPASGNMNYNAPPPTPPPSTKIHTRNLVIGAIVTIITSTIIFYLTQYLKKPEGGGDNYTKKKEATIEAWESYMAYENIYAKNILVLDTLTVGPELLLGEVKKESAKFTRDMEDLSKKKYLDNDLVKAFNRRLENEKIFIPLFEQYVQKTITLQKNNRPLQEKINEQAVVLEEWINAYKTRFDRAVNDINEIGHILSGRYPHTFDMKNFFIIQKTPEQLHKMDSILTVLQNTKVDEKGNIIVGISFSLNVDPVSVTGKWTTPGMVVDLQPKGKLTWTVSNGGIATGTWKIENDRLKVAAVIMPLNKKVNWTFKFADITPASFILANDDPPYEIYRMKKALAN